LTSMIHLKRHSTYLYSKRAAFTLSTHHFCCKKKAFYGSEHTAQKFFSVFLLKAAIRPGASANLLSGKKAGVSSGLDGFDYFAFIGGRLRLGARIALLGRIRDRLICMVGSCANWYRVSSGKGTRKCRVVFMEANCELKNQVFYFFLFDDG